VFSFPGSSFTYFHSPALLFLFPFFTEAISPRLFLPKSFVYAPSCLDNVVHAFGITFSPFLAIRTDAPSREWISLGYSVSFVFLLNPAQFGFFFARDQA